MPPRGRWTLHVPGTPSTRMGYVLRTKRGKTPKSPFAVRIFGAHAPHRAVCFTTRGVDRTPGTAKRYFLAQKNFGVGPVLYMVVRGIQINRGIPSQDQGCWAWHKTAESRNIKAVPRNIPVVATGVMVVLPGIMAVTSNMISCPG